VKNNQTYDYEFSELTPYIIGEYCIRDCFNFIVYSNNAPHEGDKILIDSNIYQVKDVYDVTTDDEREEGLSYSKVRVCLLT